MEDISFAASGYARQRFVRALFAAMALTATFLFVAMLAALVAFGDSQSQLDSRVWRIIAFWPFVALIVTALLVDLLQRIHHRITAAAILVILGLLCFGIGALIFLEVSREQPSGPSQIQMLGSILSALFVVLGGFPFVAFELGALAIWQLRTSQAHFLATRGWRSGPFNIFSNLRRQFGVPAFLTSFGRGRVGLTLLYFIVTLLTAGVGAFIFAQITIASAVSVYSEFFVKDREPPAPASSSIDLSGLGYMYEEMMRDAMKGAALVLLGLLILNVVGVGRLLARFGGRLATRVYQSVREWDERKPLVFLRTFDQDVSKLRVSGWDPLTRLGSDVHRKRTLDEILLEHGSPYGPLIAIGDPRDPVPPLGAARIFVRSHDLEWQGIVSSLIDASAAVVMCPSPSGGVRWELEQILNSPARTRTIFLASPTLSGEENLALFRSLGLIDANASPQAKRIIIAVFEDPAHGRRVISAKRYDVQSYTVALNLALASFLEPVRPRRGRGQRATEATSPDQAAAAAAA